MSWDDGFVGVNSSTSGTCQLVSLIHHGILGLFGYRSTPYFCPPCPLHVRICFSTHSICLSDKSTVYGVFPQTNEGVCLEGTVKIIVRYYWVLLIILVVEVVGMLAWMVYLLPKVSRELKQDMWVLLPASTRWLYWIRTGIWLDLLQGYRDVTMSRPEGHGTLFDRLLEPIKFVLTHLV